MPATGLLALLDDIATMSKVAATKTIGISGDDLAVNSKTLVGIDPKRELPIVYEVAKGSFKNKCILIPVALGLSAVAPWAIMPLLTVGGAYLCYEGIEKILHKSGHDEQTAQTPKDMAAIEKEKISSAIKTDLILSAEIVAVTLGAVAAAPFITQVAVLAAIGVAMTVGIYGLVGGIVKMDDVGLWLANKKGDGKLAQARRACGRGIVAAVPHVMKAISVVGTGAMFMVGGGLVLHGLPFAHGPMEALGHAIAHPALKTAAEMTAATLAGALVGLAAVPVMKGFEKMSHRAQPAFACIKNVLGKMKKALGCTKKPATTTPDDAQNAHRQAHAAAPEKQDAPSALSTLPNVKPAHDAALAPQETASQKTPPAVKTAPKP